MYYCIPPASDQHVLVRELHTEQSVGMPAVVLFSRSYLLLQYLRLFVVNANNAVLAGCCKSSSVRVEVQALNTVTLLHVVPSFRVVRQEVLRDASL